VLLLLLLNENKSFAFTHNSEQRTFFYIAFFDRPARHLLRLLLIALALARCGNQSFSAFSCTLGAMSASGGQLIIFFY